MENIIEYFIYIIHGYLIILCCAFGTDLISTQCSSNVLFFMNENKVTVALIPCVAVTPVNYIPRCDGAA